MDRLLYGRKIKALSASTMTLEVGEHKKTAHIANKQTHVTFDVELQKGNTKVKSEMLDASNQVIAGTYCVRNKTLIY